MTGQAQEITTPQIGADYPEVDEKHEDLEYRNTSPGRTRSRGKNSRGRRGRRPGGKKPTEPVLILAYPGTLDDSELKERLSSLFSQQSFHHNTDARTLVHVKDEYINIRPLKEFAKSHLRPSSSLYEVLFAEPDELEATAFLAKVGIWLRLLRREDG